MFTLKNSTNLIKKNPVLHEETVDKLTYNNLLKQRQKLGEVLVNLRSDPNADLKDIFPINRELDKIDKEITKRLNIKLEFNKLESDSLSENNVNTHYKKIFEELENLHDISITNKQHLKMFLASTLNITLFLIYVSLLKVTKIVLNKDNDKKSNLTKITVTTLNTLSWLIFKLTIFLIEIIKVLSQTNIGICLIIICFCSFYTTDYGKFCTNVFLDLLNSFFPNAGFLTIKNILIKIWEFPEQAGILIGQLVDEIFYIKDKTVTMKKRCEIRVSGLEEEKGGIRVAGTQEQQTVVSRKLVG
jgi:hypothetical protein